LLLRGEVIWRKGEGAAGNCAWGSFRSAANPVLRDMTERVVIASKGRFDRALTARQRAARGLPSVSTVSPEDFMAMTLDVWSIPPESARRVGHPAPFPVELPAQLIRLYTYADDLVLDPFMGSGSTLVAAAKLGRRYVGYDTDAAYVESARTRVAEALAEPLPPVPFALTALQFAEEAVAAFTIARRGQRVRGSGVTVPFVLADAAGATWHADVAGPLTAVRGGLARTEVVWRTLGRASALHGRAPDVPVLVLTSQLPARGTEGDTALRASGPGLIFDVIDLTAPAARARLDAYAAGGATRPLPGFWTARDLRAR
jgi:site-specific DNA-methyltransferase (adenine-specific)